MGVGKAASLACSKVLYLKDGFDLETLDFSAILHLPFEGQHPANWLIFIDICGGLPVSRAQRQAVPDAWLRRQMTWHLLQK